jgi:uncharacterized SAM-binding protein YcdF (DUF218 family)
MIVVLGCSAVLPGGNVNEIGVLSHSYGRLMKAIDVFNELKIDEKRIICTGHKGSAENMKSFLVQRGIDEGKIICEPVARNTIENCILSYKIINEVCKNHTNLQTPSKNQKIDIYLVTDDYHMERAKTIFHFFGYLLKCEKKNLIPCPSFMLQYISQPSLLQIEGVRKCYEKDKLIIREKLDYSLKFYLEKLKY